MLSATPTNDRLRAPYRSVNRDAESGTTSARQFVAFRFETGNSGAGPPSVAIPTRKAAIQNASARPARWGATGWKRTAGPAQRVRLPGTEAAPDRPALQTGQI